MLSPKYQEKVDRLIELNKKKPSELSDEELNEFMELRKELLKIWEPFLSRLYSAFRVLSNRVSEFVSDIAKEINEEE